MCCITFIMSLMIIKWCWCGRNHFSEAWIVAFIQWLGQALHFLTAAHSQLEIPDHRDNSFRYIDKHFCLTITQLVIVYTDSCNSLNWLLLLETDRSTWQYLKDRCYKEICTVYLTQNTWVIDPSEMTWIGIHVF